MDLLKSYHATFVELYRDMVFKDFQETQRVDSEAGQAAVWLVGLSSTLLALAVASPERVKIVVGGAYFAIALLLLVTVAAGVSHRVLSVWTGRRFTLQMLELYGFLTGYASAFKIETPSQLSEEWDEQEIVQRLRTELNVEYGFLLEYHVPLEGCRDAYRGQYDIWKKHQQSGAEFIGSTISNYMGLTNSEAKAMSTNSVDATQSIIKARGLIVRGMRFTASLLFTISAVSFVMAMCLVARGLWKMR